MNTHTVSPTVRAWTMLARIFIEHLAGIEHVEIGVTDGRKRTARHNIAAELARDA